MGLNSRAWRAGILIFMMMPWLAARADYVESQPLQPYNDTVLYDIQWKGVPVGKLILSGTEAGDAFEMHAISKTSGVVWLATRHKSTMDTTGQRKNGHYLPLHFETDFKLRDDTRLITLDFAAEDGRLTSETNIPEEPEWKRPRVPVPLKGYALDPLTPFFELRPRVYAALKGTGNSAFTLRYYDARRLTDLQFRVLGREVTTLDGKATSIVRVKVNRIAIAGYKEKELKEIADHDLSLELLLSDDGHLRPLQIIADTAFGNVYFNFRQACPTLDACRKLIK